MTRKAPPGALPSGARQGRAKLTPELLRDQNPEGLLQIFEELTLAWYGTTRNRTDVARDFNIARSTVFEWIDHPERLQWGVLLTMSAWLHERQAREELTERLKAISEQLTSI